MDLEQEIRRLARKVKWLSALFVLTLLGAYGWAELNKALHASRSLTLRHEEHSVSLSASNDGPFVVTHLTVRGWDTESESDKRVVALDPPLAIIDSEGGRVPDIRKLKWTNILGEPADPPGPETKITALYFRPEWAAPRDR